MHQRHPNPRVDGAQDRRRILVGRRRARGVSDTEPRRHSGMPSLWCGSGFNPAHPAYSLKFLIHECKGSPPKLADRRPKTSRPRRALAPLAPLAQEDRSCSTTSRATTNPAVGPHQPSPRRSQRLTVQERFRPGISLVVTEEPGIDVSIPRKIARKAWRNIHDRLQRHHDRHLAFFCARCRADSSEAAWIRTVSSR